MFREILNSEFFLLGLGEDPDTDVVLAKRAGDKAFCARRDMEGLLLIIMQQAFTGYLGENCKEIVAWTCSAKKLL